MRLLIIDAADASARVGYGRVGGAFRVWTDAGGDARRSGDAVARLLAQAFDEAALSPDAVDRIAAASGPGSFTGVRVAVASARALSLALDRPAVGVDGFAAVAFEASRSGSAFGLVFGSAARPIWRVYGVAEGADGAPTRAEAVNLGAPPWAAAPLWAGPSAAALAPPGVVLGPARASLETLAALAAAAAPEPARAFYGAPPDATPGAAAPLPRL